MGDDFLINTDQVRKTAKAIKDDTDELRSKTDTWLNQIDDTCKLLPSTVYELSWGVITRIRPYLNRSMEERDRINTLLQELAKQVDLLDQKIAKEFQDMTKNQPQQK